VCVSVRARSRVRAYVRACIFCARAIVMSACVCVCVCVCICVCVCVFVLLSVCSRVVWVCRYTYIYIYTDVYAFKTWEYII